MLSDIKKNPAQLFGEKCAAGGAKGMAGVVNNAINWLVPAAKPGVKTVATAPAQPAAGISRAVADAARGTFKPGVGELKRTLNETSRVYSDVPTRWANPAAGDVGLRGHWADLRGSAVKKHLEDSPRTSGYFSPGENLASAKGNMGTGRETMRHELGHAIQHNTKNKYSLPGIAGSLARHGRGTWRGAVGDYLGEIHSNAAEARGFWPQMRNAVNFAVSPERAMAYAHYGPKYLAVHGTVAGAPIVAGTFAASKGLQTGVSALQRVLHPQHMYQTAQPATPAPAVPAWGKAVAHFAAPNWLRPATDLTMNSPVGRKLWQAGTNAISGGGR